MRCFVSSLTADRRIAPNALGKLKGMLKGMIKGGSKKKQSGQDQQQYPSAPSGAAEPGQTNPRSSASPVVQPTTSTTPPTTHAPAAGGGTRTSHATQGGQAVGVGAGVGATGLAASASSKSGAPGLGDGAYIDDARVSPSEPTPTAIGEGDKSEPVSAIDEEEKPLPPPKTDSAAAPSSHSEAQIPRASRAEMAVTGLHANTSAASAATPQPAHQTLTTQRLSPALAPTDDENAKPNGMAPVTNETAPAALPAQSSQTAHVTAATVDEKIPVMAEAPPEVKPVRAAPGMSATSGPLQDFPEYGTEKEATA